MQPSRRWLTDQHQPGHLSAWPNTRILCIGYCWGSQQVHRSIICEDKLIEITPSLSDALLGLRSYLSNRNNREDKWFWVDQLCIIQADVQERSYQVSLNGQHILASTTNIHLAGHR